MTIAQQRWRRLGSTRLVYRYLPRGSNLQPHITHPNRGMPAASTRPRPEPPPRTTPVRNQAGDRPPVPGQSPAPLLLPGTAAHPTPPARQSQAFSPPTIEACHPERRRRFPGPAQSKDLRLLIQLGAPGLDFETWDGPTPTRSRRPPAPPPHSPTLLPALLAPAVSSQYESPPTPSLPTHSAPVPPSSTRYSAHRSAPAGHST